MGYDFEKTHELILASAKEHFMDKGFSGASIRQICKEAGVTNGAFYSHFASKEDLFAKIVDPVLNGFNDLYSEEGTGYEKISSVKEFERMLVSTFRSEERMISYLYEHADIFRLILTAGQGTEYEDLPGKIAAMESEWTFSFLKDNSKYIKRTENISEGIVNRISRFVVDSVFESFLEGKTKEETVRQSNIASEFCINGLKKILGF